MPNHVTNNIRISVRDMGLKEFLAKIKGECDVIDFQTIIPPPDHPAYKAEGLTAEDRKANPDTNWYDWNVEHWGTKWNAYSQSLESQWDGGDCCEVEIRFDTAWAPPLPVIEALREWPEVEWVGGNFIEEFCESAGVY